MSPRRMPAEAEASDDFWSYAALAAVAWIRAVADQRAMPLLELCERLRAGSAADSAGR